MPRILDDPLYYLGNFQAVLDWLGARYADLLSHEEHAFVRDFPLLPQASRALLVRMIMRKGTLFRLSRLDYSEIGPSEAALPPLCELGWVDDDPQLDLPSLFGLLTRSELIGIFRPRLERIDVRKAELLAALQPHFPQPQPLCQWWPDGSERVLGLRLMELCDRLRLMFFGNMRQDWSTFVLAELGLHVYEKVELAADSRGFRERRDIDEYLHLHRCRERFEAGEALAPLLAEIPQQPCANLLIEQRRAKLLFRIGQHCERSGDFAAALRHYRASSHPEAGVRSIRVHERSGEQDAALRLARQLEAGPLHEAQRQQLQRILPRLQRQLGLERVPRPKPAPVERIDLSLPRPSIATSVEHLVREHLNEAAGPVHYVENTLLNSLFGLLCWEAIFAPLPGAFFHPFHQGPADLLEADFYTRRAALFASCLAQLDNGAYRDSIRATYAAKAGVLSPFVHWGGLDGQLLEQALECLPPQHLRRCFERLLRDIRANRAGMPDLIQFWPEQGRYRMIEVKGPGDRLQDNQKRWLEFCAQERMPVQVCYVQWAQP